jgi:hypothetical protein
MTSSTVSKPIDTDIRKIRVLSLNAFLARRIWLCVLPLVVLAVYLSMYHIRTLEKQREQEAANQVFNIADGIDRDIASQIAALQMLAASPLSTDPTLQSVQESCKYQLRHLCERSVHSAAALFRIGGRANSVGIPSRCDQPSDGAGRTLRTHHQRACCLQLVTRLADQLGGNLSFEGSRGQGVAFSVIFPDPRLLVKNEMA